MRTYARWSEHEITRLKELFPITKNSELVEIFGRPTSSLTLKANELNLHKTQEHLNDAKNGCNRRRWTADEIAYLTKHYPSCNSTEIGKTLGRKREAINSIASRLKLKKISEPIQDFRRNEEKTIKKVLVEFRPAPKNPIPQHIVNKHRLPEELTNIRYYY